MSPRMTSTPRENKQSNKKKKKRKEEEEKEEEEEQKTLCPNSLQLVLVLVLWEPKHLFTTSNRITFGEEPSATLCTPLSHKSLVLVQQISGSKSCCDKICSTAKNIIFFCFSVSTSVLLGMFDRNTMHVSLHFFTSAYNTYYKHYHYVMFEKHIYMSTAPS